MATFWALPRPIVDPDSHGQHQPTHIEPALVGSDPGVQGLVLDLWPPLPVPGIRSDSDAGAGKAQPVKPGPFAEKFA